MRKNNYKNSKATFFRCLSTSHLCSGFKSIVEQKNLTLDGLSNLLQYDKSNLSKVLRGKKPFPIRKIPEWSEKLDIRPEYLIESYLVDVRKAVYSYFEIVDKES